MRVLKFTLAICTVAGFWQPPSCTSLLKLIIYISYAIFLNSSLLVFAMSQFMNILLNVDNSDELTDSLYMMLTVFVAGYKQICMWIDHKNITVMINILTEKPFTPYESHEIMIRQKFDKMIRNNTMRYLILVMVTVIAIFLSSVLMDFTKGNLTYTAWVPFDYSGSAAFTFVFAHQMTGMAASGLVNVACESLVCGFLLQMCCQLEILEHRLTKITQGQDVLRDCIHHHNLIFEYANALNKMFTKIIAVQFAVSMLVVCSNLYRIAMAENYGSFIPLMCYTGCMLAQIFIYCWFGNEVKLKSVRLMNNIYEMEWLMLNNDNKRSLLIIMKRAMVPIEFNSAYIITMNLDSFVAVLKLSYSTFNLLRQAHE
ncbi:PREDICTED: odorant receptor 46a, isoform A-like [Dinoponera quadriceps]|uniref:Odorant receptor n=1 Tax=Dinoponera quadriceps TaxID=609295 RepID=A0A6P3Y609_DINQU|nr:PREDICTED: odorant receptor 46a, isoform A-like [Dinoponera quadriceps]